MILKILVKFIVTVSNHGKPNLICKVEIFSKYNFKNKITYRIDLMYSTRIFVVAVVDFVVKPDYSADRCLDFDYFGIVDY